MTSSHTTPAGVSVLDVLDLDPGFVIKAKLAIRLTKTIAELKLTQREVAERTGLSQPRVLQIIRGHLDEVSVAKLEECLVSLGHDVTISVGPRHGGTGEIRVVELQAA